MSEKVPQTFENHAKLVPLYHFVAFGILTVNLLWQLWGLREIVDRPIASIWNVLLAFALLLVWLYARIFALNVQDRVIRLEMRLRLAEVLPAELRPRIGELRTGQLVALRFASDEELPALVREVLDQGITNRTEIKKKVKNWQADHARC
ncbi:MAG: hypothetical protein HC897_08705 [Thermoanaerobaculia bacterium]|nr:hypothetical protein [Thermoanaerobaculia bacterium]